MSSQPKSSSAPISSSTTTPSLSTQLPVYSSSRPTATVKKTTVLSTTIPKTRVTSQTPTFISNDEIMSTLQQVKQQMLQQQETNQFLLKQVQKLNEKGKEKAAKYTPLNPRSLDVGSQGSTGGRDPDFILM